MATVVGGETNCSSTFDALGAPIILPEAKELSATR